VGNLPPAERLLRTAEHYRTLLEINNAVISNPTEESLFHSICASVRRVIPHDRSAIFLHDSGKDALCLFAIESSVSSPRFVIGMEVDSHRSHVGWPFRHQEVLLRRDLQVEREFDSENALYAEGFRSVVSVPLVAKGRSIGAYCISSLETNRYSEAEADLLGQVAGQIALAIENMQAYKVIHALSAQMLQAADQSRALLEINNAIIGKLTQDELFRTICEALGRIMRFDRAALTLYDPAEERLRFVALEGEFSSDFCRIGQTLGMEDSHFGWAFANQRPLLRRDTEAQRESQAEQRAYAEGVRSFCAVPLIVRGESIGVINVLSYKKNQYSEADAEFLQEVANQVALAVKWHQDIAASRAELEAKNVSLQKEKDRLRLAVDRIPALVVVREPDGTAEMLSQRWLDYTGLSQEEVHGWDWRNIIHPDDLADLENHWCSTVASQQPGQCQARMRRFDGEYRWFQFRGTPLRDPLGNILKWYGTSTDIHDLKLAEEGLRRSEAYLAEAQRLSLTGSVGWTIPEGEQFWSEEAYRIIGLDRATRPSLEQVIERTHPDDRAQVRRTVDLALRDVTDLDFEHRLLFPDGTVKYVHVVARPFRQPSGRVDLVGAVMDVSAARFAFQEIQRLKEQLREENLILREEVDKASMFEEIVGTSPPLRAVISRVSKVAPTDSTVLITGETGTGKELIARAIHKRSNRSGRAFVSVNCGAISAGLVESELFGHVKGAFTGAIANREGRFKVADGGTIFLDEVGDLPVDTQVKLLRVLQEKAFEPIGGDKTVTVDVRIIAATNRNLDEAVRGKQFRSDLLYRLNVFPIHVPALRERRGDIPLLVMFLLQMFAQKLGKSVTRVPEGTMRRLVEYSWPGNIRELQNVLERAVILSTSNVLVLDHEFSPAASVTEAPALNANDVSSAANTSLREAERRHIESVLSLANWMIEGDKGAAKILSMNPSTLRSRMKKLGIRKPSKTGS
jgi:formate hydrogenlyase transcriptional activator